MTVRIIDPIHDSLWHDFIQTHPLASVFHSPEWLNVLSQSYQFELKAVVKSDASGVPIAGLPFVIVDDHRGKRILSLPFSDFCDSLVEREADWDDLVQPLLGENCPIITRQLHNTLPLEDRRFAVTNCAKWHGIDIQPDLDTLWNGLHDSARRAIRKSQKMGITVRIAEREELREFFKLHLQVRKQKYHLLAQPYPFFEAIRDNFIDTGKGMIFLAEYEGRVIGSLFFLGWGDVFTYKFSATHQDELQCRPTDILLWEAMRYGKALGFKMIDLGLSDWEQDGLIRFKRKYASEEKTISFLRYTPSGYCAPESKLGASLGQLTDLFTRADVPDEVTEEAGNTLYRFFC